MSCVKYVPIKGLNFGFILNEQHKCFCPRPIQVRKDEYKKILTKYFLRKKFFCTNIKSYAYYRNQ